MSRVEKNKNLYIKINNEIAEIQGKNVLNNDMSNIFGALEKINNFYFMNIIKSFNNNVRSLNPFVDSKKQKDSINEEIKLTLSKVLNEIENAEPQFDKVLTRKSTDYVYHDSEIRKLEDNIVNNKNKRFKENSDAEHKIQRAREVAFRDIDTTTFDAFCKNEKRRLIPTLKEIDVSLDDMTEINAVSYRRLSKKVKFKYYIWIYISCFSVIGLSIIGLIMLLTFR